MSAPSLKVMTSASPLYLLVLASGSAEIYRVGRMGAVVVALPTGVPQPQDAARLSAQSPSVPWAILVDQSEETFWGGAMPPLKGAAQAAWINRMADQSGTDSPYRWSQMQGKSSSQEGQLRVLGYTLGRPEALTPWLDALKSSNARLRGVYAPAMLVPSALKILKIAPSKTSDDISVLVTPHVDGLRQVVMVGGLVRFSRLALHTDANGEAWFHIVQSETAKLREYLIGNGLLKNDRAGMKIDCVIPPSALGLAAPAYAQSHPKDRYQWLNESLPFQVYARALAAHQSWQQLAPAIYRKRDISVQGSKALNWLTVAALAAGLIYVGIYGSALWQKHQDTERATQDANTANQRYLAIAKTFAKTPLTSAQLIDMSKRWDAIKVKNPPAMRDALVAAGQTLERHPNMQLEELVWIADVGESSDSSDAMGAATIAMPPPTQQPNQPATASTDPNAPPKEKKEVTALLLRGNIRGIASDDLRGTRDALAKLEMDFNRYPKIRAEITKRPLDLSAKSAVTGSGTQDKAELSFEIKLWQR
jgi:hypothetical protein